MAAKFMQKHIKVSFIYTLVLIVIQALFSGKAQLLGQDFTSVAESIVSFYPWTAVLELSKLFLYVFAIIFFLRLIFSWGRPPQKKTILNQAAASALCFLSYIAFWFSAALKYPALYEQFIPTRLQSIIHSFAFITSPNSLFFISLTFLTLALFYTQAYSFKKTLAKTSIIILFVFLLPKAALFSFSADTEQTDKNNVVMITIDSFRRDHLNTAITPNIWAIAQDPQSTLFTDHSIGIPRTFPSWKEILESQYGIRNNILHMFPGLKELRSKTQGLPSTLNQQGYSTAVISDFAGDIFPKFKTGFQTINAPKMNIKTMIELGVDQMFPLFLPFMLNDSGRIVFPSLLESPAFADPKFLSEEAVHYIRRNRDKAFFLDIFYSTAHFPYAAPWPFYSKYSDPNYTGSFLFQKTPDLRGDLDSLSTENIKQIRSLYKGALNSIDSSIKVIIDELKNSNLWDTTTLIVTADHGEDLYENNMLQGHGEHLKGTNVLKVPLIIKQPKSSNITHKTVSFLTRSIDIAPTILGLNNIPIPSSMQGTNLTPWTNGKANKNPNQSAYSETGIWFSRKGSGFFQKNRIDYPGISGLLNFDPGKTAEVVLKNKYSAILSTAKHRSLVKGDFKLIAIPTPEKVNLELYNRRDDPENKKNIARDHPDIVSTLEKEMIKIIKENSINSKVIDNYVVPND